MAAPRVSVELPTALVRLFPGADSSVEVAARDVSELIAGLEARWPGMRDRLCDSTPAIRRHICVFVAGEKAGLGTPLADGTEVLVMTAISGG